MNHKKTKLIVFNEEKPIQFLKIEHKSLLDKNNALTQEIKHQNKVGSSKNEIIHLGTKILNEIIDKWKFYEDKRGLTYINKSTLGNQ